MALFDQILGRVQGHPELTDLAAKVGIDPGMAEQIGGEGSLGRFAAMIDQDGDGNPLDELAGIAGKLFGKP